jgi:hypothetical protein
MAFVVSNSGKTAYGVNRYLVDTVDDLMLLNTANLYPGSTAFVIDSSATYMLNSSKVWVKVNLSGGSGGGSGEGDLPDNITYDGGVVIG